MQPTSAKGLIIAAPSSGAGKTTITLGLLAALAQRGLAVRGCKSGPDYIDPAFHAVATGAPSVNLDSWAMPDALLDNLIHEAAHQADVVIVESAMGLFDGVDSPDGRGGGAGYLAARYGFPVLLVLDVWAQSQTAAAVAHGLATFDPNVRVPGVILNRVAGDRHSGPIITALERRGIPAFGAIPPSATIALPERHLGLVQAREHEALRTQINALAELVSEHIKLDAVLHAAKPIRVGAESGYTMRPPGQRIAVAHDDAFSFLYPHLINGWRTAGSEIVPFSPLNDEAPPPECDVCWLPGGYPELHAARLASATTFRDGLARFAQHNRVHGECGGYMVLGRALEDANGATHEMTGLLSHVTSIAARKLHLGYREARLLEATPLGDIGHRVRGHEFHYASLIDAGSDAPLAELTDASGASIGCTGGVRGKVSGAFFHMIA